jgi:hypothetical protein
MYPWPSLNWLTCIPWMHLAGTVTKEITAGYRTIEMPHLYYIIWNMWIWGEIIAGKKMWFSERIKDEPAVKKPDTLN